jgi:hypothetical protein
MQIFEGIICVITLNNKSIGKKNAHILQFSKI